MRTHAALYGSLIGINLWMLSREQSTISRVLTLTLLGLYIFIILIEMYGLRHRDVRVYTEGAEG